MAVNPFTHVIRHQAMRQARAQAKKRERDYIMDLHMPFGKVDTPDPDSIWD